MTEKHFCSMDDLLKRRMYTVIVREQQGKGKPRNVEIDVTGIATFRWKIYYKYSFSDDEPVREKVGKPRPAVFSPERRLRRAWRDLVKKGAFIFWMEAFVQSAETEKDVMNITFDTEDGQPLHYKQLVSQKSEVVSCPK